MIRAILAEILDQLQEARANRISRRMFGLHGEEAFAALYAIRDGLRSLNKYGASDALQLKADDNGKVEAEAVYLAVCSAIDEHCPNMEEVWG